MDPQNNPVPAEPVPNNQTPPPQGTGQPVAPEIPPTSVAAQPAPVPNLAPTAAAPVQAPAAPQPTLDQYAPPGQIAPGTVQGVPGKATPVPVSDRKKQANSTQNALQLAEIRDGIVIMIDGSFRSVVMAKAINFDLMSPEEREAVEFAYQGFLNNLTFPVQIMVRSTRVDSTPYLEKLDKTRGAMDNMLLALLMEDYINYIAALSEETNIMNKQFYIVVPYFPTITTQAAIKGGKKAFGKIFDSFKQNKVRPVITIDDATLEAAKTELKNRVLAVTSSLMQVGVQSVALDTKELSELFYNAYNPDTATRQQLIDMSSLSASVIKKGQGDAIDPNLDAGGGL